MSGSGPNTLLFRGQLLASQATHIPAGTLEPATILSCFDTLGINALTEATYIFMKMIRQVDDGGEHHTRMHQALCSPIVSKRRGKYVSTRAAVNV